MVHLLGTITNFCCLYFYHLRDILPPGDLDEHDVLSCQHAVLSLSISNVLFSNVVSFTESERQIVDDDLRRIAEEPGILL